MDIVTFTPQQKLSVKHSENIVQKLSVNNSENNF